MLLGPGYGESAVLHFGDGNWVIIDSCIDSDGSPRALGYLEGLGVNPSQSVRLIVATHWHDDHIRGISRMVEVCSDAAFCCAAALLKEEFLTVLDAWGARYVARDGSGVREVYRVFSTLRSRMARPRFALANRRIYANGPCEIWSLSPGDLEFGKFLSTVASLIPSQGRPKTRIPSFSPNDVAVVLWVNAADTSILLGSDLEAKAWMGILQDSERPAGEASVFKIAHHGSRDAHEDGVWRQMLDREPFAVLTPWRRGGRVLPTRQDVRRILGHTERAYATANAREVDQSGQRRDRLVARTIRNTGIKLRAKPILGGTIRLRRQMNMGSEWKVEMFGPACHLRDYAA